MLYRIKLSKKTVEEIRKFGDVSIVVNQMLNFWYKEDIDISTLEKFEGRNILKYVDVTNPHWLELVSDIGRKSPRLNLGRFVEWMFRTGTVYDIHFKEKPETFLQKCLNMLEELDLQARGSYQHYVVDRMKTIIKANYDILKEEQ